MSEPHFFVNPYNRSTDLSLHKFELNEPNILNTAIITLMPARANEEKVFIKEYKTFLNNNFNPERAVKEKVYLYSELKHYGLSMGQIDSFFKKHKLLLAALSKNKALQLIKLLWNEASHEERVLALNILELHKEKLEASDMPLIEKLMRVSKGWALLDSLIIPLMPTILEKHKTIYSYLEKWIKSDDYWIRRSALLAQLLFFRKGKGGKKNLFFKLAESQFDESWIDINYQDKKQSTRARFFIRKAIGWTLREISIKDPDSVYNFIEANYEKMSGLTFREGSRRLPEKYRKQLPQTK